MDPPRDEVKPAIAECVRAGIKTVMITGDHKATAVAVARQLGIAKSANEAVLGSELDLLSDEQLAAKMEHTKVFARVHPEQKLRIVKSLQSRGHVVAMTGDGVNDSPALVQADVGVAMGVTGTEVAKEASKIVITDDNFATIVAAVAEGRLVYQNIKKLLLFLFVTSIDELLVLLLALLFGFHAPLAAVQILWLNLVSESALTVSLIMEPMEDQDMHRPPVPANEPLLDQKMLHRMPFMIAASLVSTFGWFLVRSYMGVPANVVQSETFTVLVVCQWFNLLNCRSPQASAFSGSLFRNPWLLGGLIIANMLHGLVIYWKPLATFFHTTPIALENFFAIGIVASLVLWVEELRKIYARRSLTI
jgi:magnesium-transporting ATPase (P-type)